MSKTVPTYLQVDPENLFTKMPSWWIRHSLVLSVLLIVLFLLAVRGTVGYGQWRDCKKPPVSAAVLGVAQGTPSTMQCVQSVLGD